MTTAANPDRQPAATTALDHLLAARRDTRTEPRLLAVGEPMHGEQAFLRLRNDLFAHLVEHWGYRSIALESSYPRATRVDAFVRDGVGSLDQAMAHGFSHGFGDVEANRELVRWMAEFNSGRPDHDRLALFGFDAPTEMASTDSPAETLGHLHGYLRERLGPDALPYDRDTITRLIGDETRWTDSAAVLDPARSPGNTADARELRLITDDLLTLLTTETPRLLAVGSRRELVTAELHGRNAAGLLRYHATLADSPSTSRNRLSRGLAVRDALMAENLRALADLEAERGPTLVFAHNSHLLPVEAHWQLGDQDLRWWSAGALLRAWFGPRYAVLATALGSAPGHGIGEPDLGTLEGRLAATVDHGTALLPIEELRAHVGSDHLNTREGALEVSYFPLEARHLRCLDALLFVRRADALGGPR